MNFCVSRTIAPGSQRKLTFLFLCLEMECPVLPYWDNTIFQPIATKLKTTVNYSCAAGYQFSSGDASKILYSTCQSDGTWHPKIQECHRKWKKLVHMFNGNAPNQVLEKYHLDIRPCVWWFCDESVECPHAAATFFVTLLAWWLQAPVFPPLNSQIFSLPKTFMVDVDRWRTRHMFMHIRVVCINMWRVRACSRERMCKYLRLKSFDDKHLFEKVNTKLCQV